MPVPVFLAVTSTPGISAFEASETVPPNVALVVWANVLIEKTTHTNNTAEQTYVFPFIFPPSSQSSALGRHRELRSNGFWQHTNKACWGCQLITGLSIMRRRKQPGDHYFEFPKSGL